MSRVIVKQLPKNITEEKLRSLFGTKGTITDIQLKYTPDGKFRQFCFIGYRGEDEAQEAIKYFNNSCIQTSRVKVELCATLGGEEKPQSWSRYAKDSIILEREAKKAAAEAGYQNATEDKKVKKPKVSKFDEIIGEHKDDPEFVEFMKAHDKNRTLWANDAVNNEEDNNTRPEEGEEDDGSKAVKAKTTAVTADSNEDEEEEDQNSNDEETKLAEKPISDLEYMKSLISTGTDKKKTEKAPKNNLELFTIKMHNVPYKTKRQDVLKFFQPLKPYSVRLPTNVHGFCYVGFKTEKDMNKAMLKNKSFIKGKQVFFSDFTEKNKITKAKLDGIEVVTTGVGAKDSALNSKWARQEDSVRNEENIAESGNIFFRNLAYTVTEEDLQQVFETFGPIAEISLPVDVVTRQIKGFGTVTFVMPEHALAAFNKLDGTIFHGRLFHLIPGKSRDVDNEADVNDPSLSFKQKKALKLKQTAGNSATWNTLFLGQNAVAEILAKKFDMSKEKILDTSDGGSSAAVRMALGETQIVIEMKKFLEDNGVRLSAFEAPTTKRSKSIILAKNLPADSNIAELSPIFAKFGPIGRIVMPPSGVTALIEYCDPSEARHAFKKLAYSKFKNLPLYLEWAPENAFKTTISGEAIIPKQEELTQENVKQQSATADDVNEEVADDAADEAAAEENDVDEDADAAPEPNTTLFLRNLNFITVPDTIRKHLKHLGSIHHVEIAQRKNPENPRHTTSMGYGFVQFKRAASADKALKQMQTTNIDGNMVELKRSDRILKSANDNAHARKPSASSKQTGSKMLVRNVPFQAKANELRDIFKAFGELRSMRLPLKMTPGADTHRGFAFVDYLSKSDAKKAFEALSQSTHLYGRRLVLEWASVDEEDVGELRKRTAEQFQGKQNAATQVKRSKKAVFDVDGQQALFNANKDDEDSD